MYNAVLIGYGYWGPNIAKNLDLSGDFTLRGVCDVDEAKLAKARELYGDRIRYYRDYREVLKDDAVDVCAVALRNDIGQTVARAALDSGRHLFMEKPMAVRMDDATTLKRMADDKRLIVHVDHILVYNSFIRYIKGMIDRGELGDVISFESNRANLGPHIKQDMNAMWDLAVHDLAIIDYLYDGREALMVGCVGERRFGKQEILTYLSVKYDGFVAMVKSSWFSPMKERSIVISGTKKMIVFDDLKETEKLVIYDKGLDFDGEVFNEYGVYEARVRTGDIYIPYIERQDALLAGLTEFAKCIREGRPSPTGPDQAMRVLSILNRADDRLAEMRRGEPV
ncbi:MAG: Gfo/Idh/MocA family oxidoreductase [Clostridiales Family XIII bacterium]|jgi:predicted dehydrogenase|nr:Gfo/Idh/MocA family oxidoreductase [Clostridiales Family XIII bacterium]